MPSQVNSLKYQEVLHMLLTRTATGKTKPRGFYIPELDKQTYFTERAFEQALQASNWEVISVLIRLGAEHWQTEAGKQHILELIQTFRHTAPSDNPIPPVLPY
jgi:hypothetical protein